MWLNENLGKGVITFDFDSTMTTPVWDAENEGWQAGDPTNLDHHHHENIDLMRKYAAQGYTIYIVTARSLSEVPEVESFVAHHKLPVADVFPTNGGPKGPTLVKLGSLIHHDDCPQEWEDPDHVFHGKWVKIYHPHDGW
jgi:hypothetical protein